MNETKYTKLLALSFDILYTLIVRGHHKKECNIYFSDIKKGNCSCGHSDLLIKYENKLIKLERDHNNEE